MRLVRRGVAADGDFASGNIQLDANPEQIALKATRVLALNDDVA